MNRTDPAGSAVGVAVAYTGIRPAATANLVASSSAASVTWPERGCRYRPLPSEATQTPDAPTDPPTQREASG
jgi:hypothetical protein